ncbi:acetyltransferase [Bacillus sp. FJAT-27231]|uniref:GNAT family N-acetyltransferase n=1 Tax=Bacillus sp. FJAT-27231 TaxID=1679168 RepID=UPI0006711C99|nr:GNAT family N-acetyltransferase [Bacillus sp. FJAT-27231]KMY53920.1 acetyltransferase [Bacillus sp. FJAT-27231]
MYYSEFQLYDDRGPVQTVIRNYTEADFDGLIEIQKACFPPPFPEELWWSKEQLKSHIKHFPEGAICVELDGELVGSMTCLIVHFQIDDPPHTWEEITDNGFIRNHKSDGNTLYVVDISVKPECRKLGLGKLMMQAMYQTVIQLKLDRLLGAGRLPGFCRYADHMSVEEYVDKVAAGELRDPVATFLLNCGRVPVRLEKDYLEDEESLNWAVLMEWKNPFKNIQTKG